MNFYDASREGVKVVLYNNDLWVVEGVNETSRQMHLRNVRSSKVCSACIAGVEVVDDQALIQAAVANIAAKEASRSLILINGFTPEQMKDAQNRCSIIVRELSGKISAQEAAKECGLSRSCYYEVRRKYSQELSPASLGAKKQRRKHCESLG